MNGDNQIDNVSDIIKFYRKQTVGGYAYSLEQIWNFSDVELEKVHNYIQWIFPTCDPRNKDTGKPFLTDKDIELFKSDKDLLSNLLNSYEKILGFYGFEHNDKEAKLVKSEDFKLKAKNWITVKNHNYLRLTRIISCLKSVGLENEAKALFDILCEIYKEYPSKIGETTFNFWQKAIDGTLYEGYVDNSIQVKELKDKLKHIKWSF